MTFEELENIIEALSLIDIHLKYDAVNFITRNGSYRGKLKSRVGDQVASLVLLIECIDVHDTSGAGNDFVIIPLSSLISVRHDAKSARLERKKDQ
jgi:hypothetical protein